MFCPGCGLRDNNANQYCRACGTDLRSVRFAVEKPDNITQSAISAREEIGRAIAAKIRQTREIADFAEVAEDLLPEIEKFLESPEERRLRRIRTGMILSSVGAGSAIGMLIVSAAIDKDDLLFLAGLGVVAFFIGLGFMFNGFFLSVTKKTLADKSSEAEAQRTLDSIDSETNELVLPEGKPLFSSVIEETTRHLDEKQQVPRN